ncbi:SDR family NAD(P)-dependent oxidoreductase [Candidatus Roizmanbacteria bacterium]|nr:SDR family NAD(P)-dependent oxidoreductase [Candidatus Roizmanbacteria bacterium]
MKTVVITGVSRGMGKATAEKFLSEGWYVFGTSTRGETAIVHENFEVYAVNMFDSQTISNFAKAVGKSGRKIDVLHNNAGTSLQDDHGAINVEVLRKTLEVNLIGLIDLTERLLPNIKDCGHIINMVSAGASLVEFSGSYVPCYQISKVGVNMYTRELATRLQERGIIVSSFDPGWVRTDMGGKDAPRDPKDVAEEIYKLAITQVESGFFWHEGKKRSW